MLQEGSDEQKDRSSQLSYGDAELQHGLVTGFGSNACVVSTSVAALVAHIRSAPSSQSQSGSQPCSQLPVPSAQLQTPPPLIQTPPARPTQSRLTRLSSPSLPGALSQPPLMTPHMTPHISAPAQAAHPWLHTGSQLSVPQPQTPSHSPQKQAAPQSSIPVYVQAQLAGTDVFQQQQLHQPQLQRPAQSSSLLQQQQQPDVAGISSNFSGPATAGQKRSHEAIAAGQDASSGLVDDKGMSVEAKRQAGIRQQHQKREAAARHFPKLG